MRRAFGDDQEAILVTLVGGIERVASMVMRVAKTTLTAVQTVSDVMRRAKDTWGDFFRIAQAVGTILVQTVVGAFKAVTTTVGFVIARIKDFSTTLDRVVPISKAFHAVLGFLADRLDNVAGIVRRTGGATRTFGRVAGQTKEELEDLSPAVDTVSKSLRDQFLALLRLTEAQKERAKLVRERVEGELLLAAVLKQNQVEILGTGEALARMRREWIGLQDVGELLPGVFSDMDGKLDTVRVTMDDLGESGRDTFGSLQQGGQHRGRGLSALRAEELERHREAARRPAEGREHGQRAPECHRDPGEDF